MSAEYTTFIRISREDAEAVLGLAKEAEKTLFRASKAPPGDRSEVVRFEALCTAIEERAARVARSESTIRCDRKVAMEGTPVLVPGSTIPDGAPADVEAWLTEGYVVVSIHLPHAPGATVPPGEIGTGPAPPAEPWKAKARSGPAAVVERFDDLLASAVSAHSSGHDATAVAAIRPSGVQNEVLTRGLRDYVHTDNEAGPIYVPVAYRDGSPAEPFPLRSLSLTTEIDSSWRILRFALMSIRHVEMDAEVTGAWLRNMLISRHRPAGLTDQVAYEASVRQLNRIADDEPSVIHMYQTGFQAAVVGFYRAVVEHLMMRPGTVAVVPQFYRGKNNPFQPGEPWAT
jgi:hypothetical protein